MLDSDTEKAEVRKQTRRAWLFVMAFAAVILLSSSLFYFRDIEPPDDFDMLPKFSEGGGRENPLRQFIVELEALPLATWYETSVDPPTEQQIQDLLSVNEAHLRLFDGLSLENISEWRWRLQDEVELKSHLKAGYFSRLLPVVKLVDQKAVLQARQGEAIEAAKTVIRLLKFSQGLERAEGSLMHWLIAVTSQAITLDTLEYVLSLSDGDVEMLKQIITEFDAFPASSLRALKHSFKVEYLFSKQRLKEYRNMIDHVEGISDLSKWYRKRFYQPNRTQDFYLAYQRPVLLSLDVSPENFFVSSIEQREKLRVIKNDWRRWLHPNNSGMEAIINGLSSYSRMAERLLQLEARRGALRLMCALRLYELQHQSLPERLGQLVPQYLDQLPNDAFDGSPLRYNKDRKILYSVSEDRIDNGGKFKAPKSHRDPDYGFHYPWSDDAKNLFEKERGPTSLKF